MKVKKQKHEHTEAKKGKEINSFLLLRLFECVVGVCF